jgi:hypothetical protein
MPEICGGSDAAGEAEATVCDPAVWQAETAAMRTNVARKRETRDVTPFLLESWPIFYSL